MDTKLALGALWARDALGRRLLSSEQAGLEREDRQVGVFYFLTHGAGARPVDGPNNVSLVMREHPEALKDFDHPAWGQGGPLYWGEPLFGYYFQDDKWVLRRHAKLLTMAGIDFIIFDTTNRTTFWDQVRPLLEVLEEYRLEGWPVPKVAYYTNTESGETVQEIYETLYKPGLFPELWFRWEGKPFIIGLPEECTAEQREFFTFRLSQWPTEEKKALGCPWIDFERPQRVWEGPDGQSEIVPVAVAQHPNLSFGDSAFYADPAARGRAYRDFLNDKTPEALAYGYNMAEQWERALDVDPRMVFFTGWNEWTAGKIQGDGDRPVLMIDQADQEYSRDVEPMRGGFFDNYYMLLCNFVRRYKGAPALPQPAPARPMALDGNFSRWTEVEGYPLMPLGTLPREHEGVGGVVYRNHTGRNEFACVKCAHDAQFLYFYAQTRSPIVFNMFTQWMNLYIGFEDRPFAPDWHGYHYLVNSIVLNRSATFLQTCKGGYRWGNNLRVDYRQGEREMVVRLPRAALGIEGTPFSLHFKWADHTGKSETIEDFYEYGDCAPYGRFDFLYRGE